MECFVAAGRSEIGNGRKLNEDSIELVEAFDGTYGIYILCDGMGGHKRGDLASELAVRYARRSILDKLNPTMEARELRALMFQRLPMPIKWSINLPSVRIALLEWGRRLWQDF